MDHEAELKDIENRFTQMLQHRQQAFDKDVARLREEAEERSSEGVQAAVDRVRSMYAACLSPHPGSPMPTSHPSHDHKLVLSSLRCSCFVASVR